MPFQLPYFEPQNCTVEGGYIHPKQPQSMLNFGAYTEHLMKLVKSKTKKFITSIIIILGDITSQ